MRWLAWTLAVAVSAPPAATPAIEGDWSGTLDQRAAAVEAHTSAPPTTR